MAEVKVSLPADAAPAMPTSGADKDALITRLDTLLEQYLHTLDEYEQLMKQLSKQLSSAYFSLTQANFHNRSGVHYGQDSYDERVQATRKIVVTEEESKLLYTTISTLPSTAPKAGDNTRADEDGKRPDPEADPGSKEKTNVDPEEKRETAKPTVDPIRMFGILVPPALRSAQVSFREAVDGPVVLLASVTGQLRALEREIGRARKGIRKAQGGPRAGQDCVESTDR